jgi:hypothetical protein
MKEENSKPETSFASLVREKRELLRFMLGKKEELINCYYCPSLFFVGASILE